jgi:NADPH-dependent 2,4-dienoyl-CoA reductase/sulfur reductase-like enzyme
VTSHLERGDERVVIIGGSAAGLSVARAVRAEDPDVEVVIVNGEDEVPWDRPPLSKRVLREGNRSHQLIDDDKLAALRVQLRSGVMATAVRIEEKVVDLADGTVLPYGDLVIATGVRPRNLTQLEGEPERGGLHFLRTQHDALLLRAALPAGARLVVVGAGFLGLEVAATARMLGCDVTVIEAAAAPLASRLGALTSQRLLDQHRERGVVIRTSSETVGLRRDRSEMLIGVEFADGGQVPADVVLVAVGCEPNIDWLHGSGVPVGNGVVCDEYCQAGPFVWAAGDVSAWLNTDLGVHTRVEHRANAAEQGRAVGLNLIARRRGERGTPYRPIPFFWTDQYDTKVQVAGYPELAEHELIEEADGGSFVLRYLKGPELVAALAWNAPKEFVSARRELARTLEIQPV